MASEEQQVCWELCVLTLLSAAEEWAPDRFAPMSEDWRVVCEGMRELGLLALAPPGDAYVIAQGGREWLEEFRREQAETGHTAQNAATAVDQKEPLPS